MAAVAAQQEVMSYPARMLGFFFFFFHLFLLSFTTGVSLIRSFKEVHHYLGAVKEKNGCHETNSSATLALLLRYSHSDTLALLLGGALLSQLPSRGLYIMFIVLLALL